MADIVKAAQSSHSISDSVGGELTQEDRDKKECSNKSMDAPEKAPVSSADQLMEAKGKSNQSLPKKHCCSKCMYSTRNKVLFDNHTCDNQDEDNDLEEQTLITLTVDKDKKYHCSECDVSAEGHAFEEHLMCHIILRPYQCLYCSQWFVNRRDVGRHVVKQHAGKKMNCALRALKRARGLMKAALETGTYEFYARVAGKVPLANDPDKDKSRLRKAKMELADKPTLIGAESLPKSTTDVTSSSLKNAVNSDTISQVQANSEKTDIVSSNSEPISSSQTDGSKASESCLTSTQDPAAATSNISNKVDSKEESAKSAGAQSGATANDGESPAVSQTVGMAESLEAGKPAQKLTDLEMEVHKELELVTKPSETNDAPTSLDSTAEILNTAENASKSQSATSGALSSKGSSVNGGVTEEKASDLKNCNVEAKETEKIKIADALIGSGTRDEAMEIADTQAGDDGQGAEDTQKSCEKEDTGAGQAQSQSNRNSPAEGKMDVDNSLDKEMDTDVTREMAKSAEGQESDKLNLESDKKDQIVEGKAAQDAKNSNDTTEAEFLESNFDQTEEEESRLGLKIVAAFSLQQDESKEGNSNDSETVPSKGAEAREKEPLTKPATCKPAKTTQGSSSETPELSSAPRTLGPPSKPVAAASFLGLSPGSDSITSPGYAAGHAQAQNCYFFVCGFGCSFSCLTSLEFRDHLMLDHAGESSFACFHCGYQSQSEDGLVRHISAHAHTYSKSAPLYICGASACKFGSNLVADFVTHQSSWHPELTAFHCHDCDERYGSVDELLKHFEANFLHIINCPHCTAKTTERKTLLHHIAAVHPGKPKMVSVAKQIVCRDRKLNNYTEFMHMRNHAVITISASSPQSTSDCHEAMLESGGSNSRNKSLVSILTEPIQPKERELTRQAAASPKISSTIKSETIEDEDDDCFEGSFDDSFDEEEYSRHGQGQGGGEIAYMGSRPDEREADNFKCKFCTFIARDRCRLEGHERCHGLPPSRKSRFKCMYCPQGFNNEHKFNSHVSCHPGLIKFSLYCCKRCDFDSNQRHIIIKHARSTRDQAHMSYGSHEEDMFAVLSKTMETRVLECTQCSYMTRHRKHLVHHIKREHSSPRKTGITVDCDIVEKYPSQSLGTNRNRALEMAVSHDRAATLPVGSDGNVRENPARRFKCPICQYLVPRAADLKAHVKRHSEIGEITLVMFRCKYCSAASTAREIIYGHLMEKHLGKQIALVKRIVTIDTRGNDNGYAVTSMEDEEDAQVDSHNASSTSEPSDGAEKTVLLIPDSAGETFQSLMPCPCCAFASYSRKTIIHHVSTHHPEVNIMGRREDSEVYPLETPCSPTNINSTTRITLGEALKGEILIVPDSQTFDEPVLCPKCDYATIHRRNIVQHLEQNHPSMSVMGRNDYPTFEGKSKDAIEANATGKDGMVIIGSGSLDEKIRCLYENYGDRMKCMICQAERPKKFFIHVHILRHLNILLWGCQFCSHRGLQKYKMMDHIKKVHPGRAFCIRYLPVNVEEKVNEYLQNASMIRARRSGEEADISPSKRSFSGKYSSTSSEGNINALRIKYKASQDKLSGCTIGSDELDMKLACLYSVGEDSRYRCVVCGQEFQRKFAVHRHIVQTHLKVNLIGCGYCSLEGVERHIMMDHIIETHKSCPINMRNLAQNLENKVAEFLSKMTLDADAALELPASDFGLDDDLTFKLPETPQLPSMLPPLEASSPRHSTPSRTPSPSSSGSHKNQLNPKLMLLGRDTLHVHLKCLIDESAGGLRCVVCNWDFPRKYAVHRHILMKHLKVGIIGCPYCSFEGVERYQVFTHIKEDHKDSELSLRYLSVNLQSIVAEYMQNVANGTAHLNSKTPPPWSMKKVPKKEILSDEENDAGSSTTSGGAEGLVVAMFGGKKSGATTIKEEPMDEDDAFGREPLDREVNGGENDNSIDYDNYVGVMDDDDSIDREVRSMSLQSANGTKAKVATDVQTNIRVITIKEKGFKRHICEKCKFTSLHRSNIVRHIYRVHEQYREQECPSCNYKTLSRVLIEQHIRNEHPGTPFPEGLPNRAMKRKPELSQEELEYDSMKKCKAAATSKRREADFQLLNSTNTQLYACAYCNFETMTHTDIVQHTRENHSLGEPMKNKEDEQSGLSESEASKSHENERDFESQAAAVRINQGDLPHVPEDTLWQCFYCSYKTSNEEDLKIHFADAHPGNVYMSKKIPTWRFVCRSCHVKTRAHSKMRYHLNRHINYRPYTCTTCGSFYPSPDQCRKHCRANNHNETFTYVKIPRKEKRLQQLLKECQEIALALTKNPKDPNITLSPALSFPVPSKRKAKKSFTAVSRAFPARLRKNYEYDAPYSPRRLAAQREDKPKEEEAQMVCASCDFTAQNVCDVWLHFIKEHETQDFQWMDMATGHICTETGEITNAKDVPPDLDAPPGPGYCMLSNRLLSCEHCDFTTSTVQAMKSHLRRHLPKRYLCPYCSLRCSRRDTISQHVRCGHRGRELWTIFFRLPDGFVPDSSEADANSGVAEAQVTFQANVNSEETNPAPAAAPVSVLERIKCGHCEKKSESITSIYEHHGQEHPELEFLWIDSTNGYTCNQTGEVTDARELSPQLFTQDGFTVEPNLSSVPTFSCKFCQFTSAFIQAIKSHMKSHLPHGFMCPYCCMCTNSKEKMMSHQSCTHREQEPWILHLRMSSDPTSQVAATAAVEKNLPVIRRETGITNYSCNECDYTSENFYQYRLHLANHGSFPHLVKDIQEDQPFKCGYCAYVAEDEGDFGAHIASHLERRNYCCSKCEFTAFERSTVQSHIQTEHDETEDIQVIDLQAENLSEQEGPVEEPQLVNLDPKVKVVPVNDLDLDREGLTLFSPPPTPETEMQVDGVEFSMDNDDVGIIGLETPSAADMELDNQSDSTEEWGTNAEDYSREGSPALSDQAQVPPGGGGSILRLTLQGKLTGEYGIKRAVPVDMNPTLTSAADTDTVLTDASASRDSVLSQPSGSENNATTQQDGPFEDTVECEAKNEVSAVEDTGNDISDQAIGESSWPLLENETGKEAAENKDAEDVFAALDDWLEDS